MGRALRRLHVKWILPGGGPGPGQGCLGAGGGRDVGRTGSGSGVPGLLRPGQPGLRHGRGLFGEPGRYGYRRDVGLLVFPGGCPRQLLRLGSEVLGAGQLAGRRDQHLSISGDPGRRDTAGRRTADAGRDPAGARRRHGRGHPQADFRLALFQQ